MGENQVIAHTCPNCSGPLTFEPNEQCFYCAYCQSRFHEEELARFEKEHAHVQASQEKSEDSVDVGLFTCPNCAAQITTEATTAATNCYYCHTPVVLSARLEGKFLPEKVLPFKIDRKEAEKQFLQWAQKKKFVPSAFFNREQVENLTGVYFPYWLSDAEVSGSLRAKATSVRVWRIGDTEYTETKHFQIFREGILHFKEFIQNALQKNEPEKMIQAIQPFDLRAALPFKTSYLSGFLAEKRDIEFEELLPKVEEKLKEYSNSLLCDTIIDYTSVSIVSGKFDLTALQKAYVLLPVWIVTYKVRGSKTLYYYAMNGQTGKTAGVLPIAKARLFLISALLFLIVLSIGLIVGWYI